MEEGFLLDKNPGVHQPSVDHCACRFRWYQTVGVGKFVLTFHNQDQVWLGRCDLIEHVMIGEDKLLRFSEVPLEEACTVVIRGATQYDALCTLAATVEETLGKEFMAIQSFGRAMLSYESRQRVISSVDSFSCYWSETSQSLDHLHRFAQHPTGPVISTTIFAAPRDRS